MPRLCCEHSSGCSSVPTLPRGLGTQPISPGTPFAFDMSFCLAPIQLLIPHDCQLTLLVVEGSGCFDGELSLGQRSISRARHGRQGGYGVSLAVQVGT